MTPIQEIRAAAIKAAASFCAPLGGVTDQQMPDGTVRRGIPDVEDVLFVADVFCGYIEGGWKEALGIHVASEKQSEEPTAVGSRECTPAEDILLPELESQPALSHSPTVKTPSEDEDARAREADVIPIQAHGGATKGQRKSLSFVNRVRRERAMQIYREALVAKAEDHKQRLIDDAEGAGLRSFELEVGGATVVLGDYLDSL